MPRLYVTEPHHVYTFELPVIPGAEVYIGTSPQCQLSLPGVPGLAEVHACIRCMGAEYVIVDMGASTGTFVNGVPVSSVSLLPGAECRLGAAIITMMAESSPPPHFFAPVQSPRVVAPPPYGAAPLSAPPPYGMPQPVYMPHQAQPPQQGAVVPPAQQQQSSAPSSKVKVRRLNAQELDDLKSRFYNPRPEGFPLGKIILFVLLLLAIAFFSNMLPVHREDALNFFRILARDMETPASAVE